MKSLSKGRVRLERLEWREGPIPRGSSLPHLGRDGSLGLRGLGLGGQNPPDLRGNKAFKKKI